MEAVVRQKTRNDVSESARFIAGWIDAAESIQCEIYFLPIPEDK